MDGVNSICGIGMKIMTPFLFSNTPFCHGPDHAVPFAVSQKGWNMRLCIAALIIANVSLRLTHSPSSALTRSLSLSSFSLALSLSPHKHTHMTLIIANASRRLAFISHDDQNLQKKK
jgi:hypothetical protein